MTRQEEALPRLRHDNPAAVLVLDVRTGQVVQASARALALSGGHQSALPVPLAQWLVSAGVDRPDGEPYPDGDDPLSRAASGTLPRGEQVVVATAAGLRALWVTGFPLPVDGQHEHALVVLVDVDGGPVDAEAAVRDRAVVAAGLSFTISDPRQPDNPLVFVNPAFERTTGYGREEVLGRNCRFLQGADTDPEAVERVREAIRSRDHAVITLLNHRKDGTAFWNELSLSPVYDAVGELTHFVGIQADVTARVLVEQERNRHLLAERRARADAEQMQVRLALLAEATSMLSATLDVDEALRRLAALCVPVLADWCMVELFDDDRRRLAHKHVDPDKDALLATVERLQPSSRQRSSPVARVLESGEPLLLATVEPRVVDEAVEGSEITAAYHQLQARSAVIVPLRARDRVLGVLTLVHAESGRTYDDDDLVTAADLARRAALTVDNARLYEREHAVAEQLQRSLLPQLPTVPGLDLAARYLPGSTAAQVGGDWYDVFPLPDGAVGVAIGDVMGHDLQAAASMGQLRSVLRSYAWQGGAPAQVLDHLDQLVQGLHMAQLATCVYGRLTLPADGEPGRMVLANAGHLPPVLRRPDGTTVLLDGVGSVLVGATTDAARDEQAVALEAGSVLVLCTDGLVERRGLDPDDGLDRLRAAVERAGTTDAEALCDLLLAKLAGGELDDDVALLVVRVL